ncbi:hypothetical protein BD410DRAFT_786763 [Rickenella mellea]|uniref:Zn(2)-C6 fungal-type domain-containing protein n=1 Tax=Rickenella mellea TaxID=50990 RepID=A0A4Y7Q9U8_9AGAM|nr:hypothetical protein BD410DRAFT_786763 [Rickenella mellea]
MSTNPFTNPTSGPSSSPYPGSSSNNPPTSSLLTEETERANLSTAVFKGPKRKRLVKACDACHKSKRRCDGTAPCSNCYFASKDCKYTDASGNPVPAPNAGRPQRFAVPTDPDLSPPSGAGQAVPQPYPAGAFDIIESPYLSPQDPAEIHSAPRKRLRWEHDSRGIPIVLPPPVSQVGTSASTSQNQTGDPSIIRELTSLFFAHCHPHRLIIHQVSFYMDLSLDCVPLYLVNSICAMAAPFSSNPRIQMSPRRFAGHPFAQAARSQLFDENRNFVGTRTLYTAQALCLLQMYDLALSTAENTVPLFDYTFRILEELGVRKPDNPIPSSPPPPDQRKRSIERECIRRVYSLIHLTILLSSAFGQTLIIGGTQDPTVRLPCDETCFELSTHSSLPEYLTTSPPKTAFSSEFGQLIRLANIFLELEKFNTDANPDTRFIFDSESKLQAWVFGLADHLIFSRENLNQHMTLWETTSSTSAWCFCYMHILHAYCSLLVIDMKRSHYRRQGQPDEGQYLDRVSVIISALGVRGRNSPFMGIITRFLYYAPLGYAHADSNDDFSIPERYHVIRKELEVWVAGFEELWGPRAFNSWTSPRLPGVSTILHQSSLTSGLGTTLSSNVPISEPIQALSSQNQYPSLAQSINDLHLQSSAGTSDESRTDTGRWNLDSFVDPALRGRTTRAPTRHPEVSPQGLPSLKASGLLETWGPPEEPPPPPSRGAASPPLPPWLSSPTRNEPPSQVRRSTSASAALRHHRSRSPSQSVSPYPPPQSFTLSGQHSSASSGGASARPWLSGEPPLDE